MSPLLSLIKDAAKAQDISESQVLRQAGVNPRNLSNWRSGRSAPSKKLEAKLQQALEKAKAEAPKRTIKRKMRKAVAGKRSRPEGITRRALTAELKAAVRSAETATLRVDALSTLLSL